MFPRSSFSNITYSCLCNPKHFGELCTCSITSRVFSYILYLIFGEGCKRVLFSKHASFFNNHVGRIISTTPYIDMIGIYASIVIAFVTGEKTFGYLAIFMLIHISTEFVPFTAYHYSRVPITVRCAYPASVFVYMIGNFFTYRVCSFLYPFFTIFSTKVSLSQTFDTVWGKMAHTFSKYKIPGEGKVCEEVPRFNDRINRVRFINNGVFADSMNNIIHVKGY